MSHSNHLKVHWWIVGAEIFLFIVAIVAAYLSKVGEWKGFFALSLVATVVFAIVKLFEAMPAAKELITREDFASRIAASAGTYGVRDYFNMQDPREQARRNEVVQDEIRIANQLWLCANSGASFLDPAIYRHWQAIEKRLNGGAEFRVVLLDPFSGEKSFRNQLNVSGESLDSKINIANLIKLHNSYPGLEIRFSQYGMHATVFATERCLFFDPYHVGTIGDRIENRSFALRVEPTEVSEGVGLHRLFKSHFDSLWRSSISFDSWISQVQAKLPPGLPILRAR
jgi:hypothetical protein